MTQEDNFLILLDIEVDIVKENGTVCIDSFQILYFEDLVTGVTIHLEDDARILAAGWTDLLYIEFFQHLLTRCGLLALCHIGREAADELFQLLLLFFSLHALVLSLTQSELGAFVPETVVTGKDRYFTEVDVDGLCAHGVKEVTVVADNEHRLVLVNIA